MHKLTKWVLVGLLILPLTAEAQDGGYKLKNLVANKQIYGVEIVDKNMINPWGLANRPAGAGGHFWINNTDTGTVSLYVGDVGQTKLFQDDLKLITVATPNGFKGHAAPTGQVFNGNPNEFMVSGENISAGSKFIFATEEGTISGWTETKNADGTKTFQTRSVLTIDNSKSGAVYKGLAIANRPEGSLLYAADFGRGRVDVYDGQWRPVKLPKNAFKPGASNIPKNYAPFNAKVIGEYVYVAYAKLSKEKGEEEKCAGCGYVTIYDLQGQYLDQLQHTDKMNAPWAIVQAPANFGDYSETILVGNFGSGRILAYSKGAEIDYLRNTDDEPLEIDGLWDLMFGNGASLGESNHLYFTAGPNDEKDGVFGKIYWQESSLSN